MKSHIGPSPWLSSTMIHGRWETSASKSRRLTATQRRHPSLQTFFGFSVPFWFVAGEGYTRNEEPRGLVPLYQGASLFRGGLEICNSYCHGSWASSIARDIKLPRDFVCEECCVLHTQFSLQVTEHYNLTKGIAPFWKYTHVYLYTSCCHR